MEIPLIPDKNDFKWQLLSHVFKICDSRKIKLVMARSGITPVNKAGVYIKIVLISMYFSQTIAYVIRELEIRKELRAFVGIPEVPKAGEVSKFFSKFTPEQVVDMVLKVLNTVSRKKQRRDRTVIVDSTDITLDLNWVKRRIR